MTYAEIENTFMKNGAYRKIKPRLCQMYIDTVVREMQIKQQAKSYEEQAAEWYSRNPDATKWDF